MIYQKRMQHNGSEDAGPRAYPCHPRLSALVNEPAVEKKMSIHLTDFATQHILLHANWKKTTLVQENEMSEPFTKFISASSPVEQRVGSVPP